jgi:hypothetical protein
MKRWGTLARKVVTALPISGRACCCLNEAGRLLGKVLGRIAGPVLDVDRESRPAAQTGDGRGAECENLGLVDGHEEFPVQRGNDFIGRLSLSSSNL